MRNFAYGNYLALVFSILGNDLAKAAIEPLAPLSVQQMVSESSGLDLDKALKTELGRFTRRARIDLVGAVR